MKRGVRHADRNNCRRCRDHVGVCCICRDIGVGHGTREAIERLTLNSFAGVAGLSDLAHRAADGPRLHNHFFHLKNTIGRMAASTITTSANG
jgi:hypothetical protein